MIRRDGIRAGQVWITRSKRTRSPSRRIVDVVGERVYYCAGTGTTRSCRRATFVVWARRCGAYLTRTRRGRTLVLRR